MDHNALDLLRKRVYDHEDTSDTPVDPTDNTEPAKNASFIGFHCPETMRESLKMFAGIDRITLSQFVREVLQMELLRLTRGETSSREQLMRERRAALLTQGTGKASVLD